MTNSIKLMIFGVAVMVVSIFIQNEAGIQMHGNEVFILLFGFIITIFGALMKGGKKHD